MIAGKLTVRNKTYKKGYREEKHERDTKLKVVTEKLKTGDQDQDGIKQQNKSCAKEG